MNRALFLTGVGGAFLSEIYLLEMQKPYVVGRSRDTDISLRRTQHFLIQSDVEREADKAAKTVSARHFQITYFNTRLIEIKNLSVNGTRLDGKPIGGSVIITDITRRAHLISFGETAKFKLEFRVPEKSAVVAPI